jgi:hypothetical protein
MLSFLKAWMLSFLSVQDVIIFNGVNVIIFEFHYVIFLIVEDVIIFHDVNVMITINDNINDNTKYVQGKMITFADREK